MKAVLPGTTPAARVCLICIFVCMNTDGARQDGRHARLASALFGAVVEAVARCVVQHEGAGAGKYRWKGGWSGAALCLEGEKSGRAIKLRPDQIIPRHKTPGTHSGLLLRPGGGVCTRLGWRADAGAHTLWKTAHWTQALSCQVVA